MLNSTSINAWPIDEIQALVPLNAVTPITSFTSIRSWQYSFVSDSFGAFNFNTMLWKCSWWVNRAYWNYLTEHNFDDIAQVDITEYDSPLINWWIIQNRRFTNRTFKVKMVIVSSSWNDLLLELQTIKKTFNSLWRLYRTAYNRSEYINVRLTSFNVWTKTIWWTEIDFEFYSVDPLWINTSAWTVNFEWLTSNFDWSFVVSDSDIEPNIRVLVQVLNITWVVTWLTLNLNWYEIKVTDTVSTWDIIVFDWKNNLVTINNSIIKYEWQYFPFPLWLPWILKLDTAWAWTMDNYAMYIIYDKQIM